MIKGYSTPFRLDRNQNGEGLLLYVNEDIPCKILNEYTPENLVENLFVEMNSRSRKWLLSCSYNPVTNLKADHLHCIGKRLDFYSSKYGNVIVLGGLNTQIFNSFLGQFLKSCTKSSYEQFQVVKWYWKKKIEAPRSAYKRQKFLCETIKKDQKGVLQTSM